MPRIELNQNQIKSALAKQLASFPYFDSTELNNALNVILPGGYLSPEYALGSTFTLQGTSWGGFGGASFQFVKLLANSTTLAAGNLVAWAPPTAGTITASGSTTSAIKTNIDTTNLGNCAGALLSIQDASTPILTIRRILSSTVGTNAIFTIAKSPDSLVGNQTAPVDALSAVPTNGQPCEVIFPNQVVIYPHTSTGSFGPPAGVALGAVTAGAATVGNYTLIQKTGVALVTAVGSGTAITIGDIVVPSGATDGVVIGAAAASAVAVGIAQRAYASTAQNIPVLLTGCCP